MARHIFIHYANDKVSIGASDMPEFGKRPSLLIGRDGVSTKVASFQSVEAAQAFTDALYDLIAPMLAVDE